MTTTPIIEMAMQPVQPVQPMQPSPPAPDYRTVRIYNLRFRVRRPTPLQLRSALILLAVLLGWMAGWISRTAPPSGHNILVPIPVIAPPVEPIPSTPGFRPASGPGDASIPLARLGRQTRHLRDLQPGEMACTYLDFRVSNEGSVWVRDTGVAELPCTPDAVHALLRRKVSGGWDAVVGVDASGRVPVCCGPDRKYARGKVRDWLGNDGGVWTKADSVEVRISVRRDPEAQAGKPRNAPAASACTNPYDGERVPCLKL